MSSISSAHSSDFSATSSGGVKTVPSYAQSGAEYIEAFRIFRSRMTDKEMSEDDLSHAWRTLSGEDKSPFLHLARRNLVAIKMPSSFSQRLSSEKGSDKGSAHNEFDGNNGSNNQEINADGTNAVGSTNKQVTMASHIEADAGASTVAWNIPDAQTDDANAPTPTRRRSPSFTHAHIVHEGFLWKKGQRRHNWKRRYFVLAASDAIVTSKSSFDLFYYDMKTAIQRKLLGSVAVTGSQVLNVAFSGERARCQAETSIGPQGGPTDTQYVCRIREREGRMDASSQHV